ncbi:hypothetical protein [Streptomyces sp. NPDC001530]|uniref:hypothetical protein n=1 Tax=Streptomyces sp. NPDC001530 TaxID=3364582 RepID=UPI0036CBEE28
MSAQPASPKAQSGSDLAATGGDSDTTIPLAAGGALLLAVGSTSAMRTIRRRSRSSARHAR